MAQSETERKMVAPYFPYRTFLTSLDVLNEGVPEKLDRTVWRTQSGQAQSQTMKAYQFLGLIDQDGNVQPVLHELVSAKDRRPLIKRLLEDKYAKVVALGAANASQADLETAMREQGVQGETMRKAIAFFVQAAQDTGIKLSPFWAGVGRKAPSGTPRRRTTGTKRAAKQTGMVQTPTPPAPTPPAQPPVNVHPMLAGAIQWLYENGQKWTEEQSEAWCTSFISNVRLVYPPTARKLSAAPAASSAPRRTDGKPSANGPSGGLAGQNEAVGA